jgi:SpoVK/Ycf46/Vps4 family AAA+-type ATPase
MEIEKKYKNEKRRLGQLHSLYFNITDPIKFEKVEIEFNKLSLFVGANGSGKTFLLINSFSRNFFTPELLPFRISKRGFL